MKFANLLACAALAALVAPPAAAEYDLGVASTGGSGVDVGHGGGKFWAVGTTGKVYRFDSPPGAWTEIGGVSTGLRIDVDAKGLPWVVTRDNKLMTWNGSSWSQVPGDIREIGRSAAGDHMWAIGGGGDGRGNFDIYRFEGAAGWAKKPGNGLRIDVEPDGTAWVVNAQGGIYRWNGSAWDHIAGGAKDIGVGSNGAVWIIGSDGAPWSMTYVRTWLRRPGATLAAITVDDKGNPLGAAVGNNLLRLERHDRLITFPGSQSSLSSVHARDGRYPIFTTWEKERWDFPPDGTVKSLSTRKCLSIEDGRILMVKACDGSPGTKGWYFNAADSTLRNRAYPNGCAHPTLTSQLLFSPNDCALYQKEVSVQ